jgi:hypothetical protein
VRASVCVYMMLFARFYTRRPLRSQFAWPGRKERKVHFDETATHSIPTEQMRPFEYYRAPGCGTSRTLSPHVFFWGNVSFLSGVLALRFQLRPLSISDLYRSTRPRLPSKTYSFFIILIHTLSLQFYRRVVKINYSPTKTTLVNQCIVQKLN